MKKFSEKGIAILAVSIIVLNVPSSNIAQAWLITSSRNPIEVLFDPVTINYGFRFVTSPAGQAIFTSFLTGGPFGLLGLGLGGVSSLLPLLGKRRRRRSLESQSLTSLPNWLKSKNQEGKFEIEIDSCMMTLFCQVGVELTDEDLKLSEKMIIQQGDLNPPEEVVQMFEVIFGTAHFGKALGSTNSCNKVYPCPQLNTHYASQYDDAIRKENALN